MCVLYFPHLTNPLSSIGSKTLWQGWNWIGYLNVEAAVRNGPNDEDGDGVAAVDRVATSDAGIDRVSEAAAAASLLRQFAGPADPLHFKASIPPPWHLIIYLLSSYSYTF